MKVIVLDGGVRKRADSVREAFSQKQIDATICTTSNEFLAAVDAGKYASIYIDMETWKKGRCIYEYFGISSKFESKPAVFYNAEENFGGIVGRNPHEQDRIVYAPSDVEAAIESVAGAEA
ncbi:MAG: hypothetical protein LBU70_01695 [Chitinispirillales bacterium]|jgi:hypothetical protein|nr:hypothetical protein [Chitinispirillales bacterium]